MILKSKNLQYVTKLMIAVVIIIYNWHWSVTYNTSSTKKENGNVNFFGI